LVNKLCWCKIFLIGQKDKFVRKNLMLKAGIIGYANHEKYLQRLITLREFSLVGLYDARFLIEKSPQAFPIEIYSSIASLTEAADVLFFTHGERINLPLIEYCLKQGKSVFLDSTYHFSTAEHKRLEKLKNEAKEVVQIFNPNGYNKALELAFSQNSFFQFADFRVFGLKSESIMYALQAEISNALLLNNKAIKEVIANPILMPNGSPDTISVRLAFVNNTYIDIVISKGGAKEDHSIKIYRSDSFLDINITESNLYVKKNEMEKSIRIAECSHSELLQVQFRNFYLHVIENSSPLYSIENEHKVKMVMDAVQKKLRLCFSLV
jgi:hypothetical protein